MRSLSRFMLTAVAACVVAAIGASAASAASPEVWQCGAARKNAETKKYIGHFTDKKCSKEATAKEVEEGKTNKYEFEPWAAGENNKVTKVSWGKKGKVKAFKGKTPKNGAANLEVQGQNGIACAGGAEDEGVFTGPTTAELKVKFFGCETSGLKCTNAKTLAGEEKGEIEQTSWLVKWVIISGRKAKNSWAAL